MTSAAAQFPCRPSCDPNTNGFTRRRKACPTARAPAIGQTFPLLPPGPVVSLVFSQWPRQPTHGALGAKPKIHPEHVTFLRHIGQRLREIPCEVLKVLFVGNRTGDRLGRL